MSQAGRQGQQGSFPAQTHPATSPIPWRITVELLGQIWPCKDSSAVSPLSVALLLFEVILPMHSSLPAS